MTQNKLPTIKLQGKEYSQVKDRVMAFNEIHKNGSIQTESRFQNDVVIFKATIYPDIVEQPTRLFTASSFGGIKGLKAFEKLESVAVGRALAYLGFGIDGSIASSDEMEVFFAKQETIESQPESKPQQQSQSNSEPTLIWLKDKQLDDLITKIDSGEDYANEAKKLYKLYSGMIIDGNKYLMNKQNKEVLTQIINNIQDA